MWWTILAAAYADTLELDNGAVLLGELAAYDRAGACHIAVAEGSLSGAIVVVPCDRVVRIERERPVTLAAPAPAPPPEPALAVPVPEPVAEPVAEAVAEPVYAEDEAPVAEPPPVAEVPVADSEPEPLRKTWLDNLQFSDPFRR